MKRKIRIILPILVLTIVGVLYMRSYPTKYRKFQVMAYSTRELRINDRITSKDFTVKPLLVFSKDYKYTSPEGMFMKSNVVANTPLDASNTVFYKESHIISTAVRVPVVLDKSYEKGLRMGDEIALIVNGKVFPERKPSTNFFTVLELNAGTDEKKITVLLEVQKEHITDSLWLNKTGDHIIPMVLKSVIVPSCPKGEKAEWVKDPLTLRGTYVCKKAAR